MAKRFSIPEGDVRGFYGSRTRKPRVWEPILEIGTDWLFEQGKDFSEKISGRDFVKQVRTWLRTHGHDYKLLNRVAEDESVVLRLVEWTEEENVQRRKRAEEMRLRQAARKIREQQEEAQPQEIGAFS